MRIAVCISNADPTDDGQHHVALAERYVAEAADRGAQVVVFPETFPGRWRAPISSTPLDALCQMASRHGVYVAGGYPEPVGESSDRCYNTVSLCGPDGTEHGRYRRVAPSHAPWTYRGGRLWDFEWERGIDLPVFSAAGASIGILICSEVYVPELARILTLQGAEVLLYPTGVLRPASELFDTWRTAARARAIDNTAAVALCSNGTPQTGPGFGLVCSPETILLETTKPGVHVADIDVERIRWLREERDRVVEGTRPWRTKPGLARDWRPTDVLEQYAGLLLGPQPDQREGRP